MMSMVRRCESFTLCDSSSSLWTGPVWYRGYALEEDEAKLCLYASCLGQSIHL